MRKLKSGFRFPKCVRLLVWVLGVALGASQAGAQERLLPIRLGRIEFFPSLGISAAHEDNVEKLNEDDPLVGPVDSGIRALSPQLRFELPFTRSITKLIYRGDFRQYSADILKDLGGASHFLNLTGHFEVGRLMKIDVADSYVDGITGLLNSVPGGEYRYATQPLTSNDISLQLAFQLGAIHSVELGGSSTRTQFEESSTSDFFSDFESQRLFARYVLDSGAGNSLYGYFDIQGVQQDRAWAGQLKSEYETRSLGAGYRRATSRELSSEVRVSYSHTDFTEGFGTPFRGITFEGDLAAALASGSLIQIRFRRAPQVSFFNVSPYYVNEGGEVVYTHALGRTVVLATLVNFQYNVYSETVVAIDGIFDYLAPSEGMRRRDKIWTGALNLTWKLSRAVDLTAGYRFQNSDSNIVAQTAGVQYAVYSYDSHGIILATIIGWQ
ncbi:MAG TPA: outer membrane beta-barrel protein [Candidatus Polarisedimenticolia bacterium]|nr:outer membrane beta-barrel protein [Candidatus Polarisedimenticolia bacterium]